MDMLIYLGSSDLFYIKCCCFFRFYFLGYYKIYVIFNCGVFGVWFFDIRLFFIDIVSDLVIDFEGNFEIWFKFNNCFGKVVV